MTGDRWTATNELVARMAAGPSSSGFHYTIDRAGEGLVRVAWTGGSRNGETVTSGDVTVPLDATYERLITALRAGGFTLYR
jgi:hypothetical protein